MMERADIERLKEIEQRSKSNTKRLDEHDEQLKELGNVYIALTKTNDKVDKIESDVSEMKDDLKEIKDTPKKRLDGLWNTIVSLVLGGIITFLFMKLGMK